MGERPELGAVGYESPSAGGVNPIGRRSEGGGDISWRMASNTTPN
jgi:hypothetical protein